MKYDFIEIGTSDFRALAFGELRGISVEPVPVYFNALPDRAGLIRLNVAVSDRSGTCIVYYCDPEVIKARALPNWLRGCNSINAAHPTASGYSVTFPDLVKTKEVQVISIGKLMSNHAVTEVDLLKIDTEGHDCVILKKLLSQKEIPYIREIQFESNVLSNEADVNEVISLGVKHGYKHRHVESRGNRDTILFK